MSDREALQRAILANPDDDLPRLVYADWLDENEPNDRAAFIRAQIEAYRADPFSITSRLAEARAQELLQRHHAAWTSNVTDYPLSAHFERGFIERITIHPSTLLHSADQVFEHEPITTLGFSIWDRSDLSSSLLARVLELPHLRRLRGLSFDEIFALQAEELIALADCPQLLGLRSLSLRGNPVPPPWLATLLASPAFPELCDLDLAHIANLGPALAEGIAEANHRTFRRLDLTEVRFTSHQLRPILTSRSLRQVERLRLGWNGRPEEPGPLSYLELGWVIPWIQLVQLDLSGHLVGDEGVRQIARRPEARALRWLGLAKNQLGSEAVRLLVESPFLQLNHLDLRDNRLRPHDLTVLRSRFPEAQIEF